MPTNRTSSPFGVQAEGSKYFSARYLSPERLSSVGWQINLCDRAEGCNFIGIGSGNNLPVWSLRQNGKLAWSLDHNAETMPNMVGVLPRLPIKSGAADVVLIFKY